MDNPVPTPLLGQIGAALYGPHWRNPVAEALGVRITTCQRWANGAARIPPSVAPELLALIDARLPELLEARRKLIEWIDQHPTD